MNVEDIFFNIDKSIPIALTINEILSKIFKYAFQGKTNTIEMDKKNKVIEVSLSGRQPLGIRLFISDNGNGFPENFDPETSKSIGMYLIKNFAKRQLKGKIKIISFPEKGVQYEIIFN